MGILTCPVCRARLERKDKSFVCSRGHSFDLSASGYLHLLPSSQMRSKVPGDNRQMVQARRNFLQKGYYQPISDALNRQLLEHCKKNVPLQILDAGCGEGYYTNRLAQFLGKEQPDFSITGVDISKFAVDAAAKGYAALCRSGQAPRTRVQYGVASVFELPVKTTAACGHQPLRAGVHRGVPSGAAPRRHPDLCSDLHPPPVGTQGEHLRPAV